MYEVVPERQTRWALRMLWGAGKTVDPYTLKRTKRLATLGHTAREEGPALTYSRSVPCCAEPERASVGKKGDRCRSAITAGRGKNSTCKEPKVDRYSGIYVPR